MPDYRDVKRPATLASRALTESEAAMVEAGGNEAAIGTDLAGAGQTEQLSIWYANGRTIVAGTKGGEVVDAWSFAGNVSPFDCRAWYLAKVGQAG
jgi:hypothetical protein